jgi:hypothetical protein
LVLTESKVLERAQRRIDSGCWQVGGTLNLVAHVNFPEDDGIVQAGASAHWHLRASLHIKYEQISFQLYCDERFMFYVSKANRVMTLAASMARNAPLSLETH